MGSWRRWEAEFEHQVTVTVPTPSKSSAQGLANTLPRRRAGALCKQTGREERLGAGEDETFHAKREAGLLWELEGEAKVLKGAGSRRP